MKLNNFKGILFCQLNFYVNAGDTFTTHSFYIHNNIV